MADEIISPKGPIFGPDFIMITVNDETGTQYHLEIYPDVYNELLKANGMATQYYFVPQRVYLAKKQNAPADYDFAMSVFKGLMTSETSVGVTDDNTSSGTVEAGGGFCSFSTTFAIPDSVIGHVIQLLKRKDHPTPPGRIAHLFNFAQNDPDPLLGIVPILENNVTIEPPELANVGNSKMPFYISAQGNGKGSIEAAGISSWLVTCNELAAGAIAGSLKKGVSPFTVHYNLKQMFYINACDIIVHIDVDKVFNQFSAAVSAGGFLGIDSASLS
jgi:hypothetical protein